MVDISENDRHYSIQAELPGVKRENVRGGVLTISGERKDEREEDQETLHRVERSYGSFTLPEEADEDQIQARFEDGVLQITLPKRPESEPEARRIDVQG